MIFLICISKKILKVQSIIKKKYMQLLLLKKHMSTIKLFHSFDWCFHNQKQLPITKTLEKNKKSKGKLK